MYIQFTFIDHVAKIRIKAKERICIQQLPS